MSVSLAEQVAALADEFGPEDKEGRNYYIIEILSSGECESYGPISNEDNRDKLAKALAQSIGEDSIVTSMDHTILWASVEGGKLRVGNYLDTEIDDWFYDGTYVDHLIKEAEKT